MDPRIRIHTKMSWIRNTAGEDKRNSLGLLTRLNVSLGLDYRRINGLALLGWRYCVLSGLPKPAEQFSQLYVKAAWGRRTADMGVCFKGLCHKIATGFQILVSLPW
jgi:hypothetical protein